MDKRIIEEIISSAINIASGGRVESINQVAPDKMMTSDQMQKLNITEEDILEALRGDPRVVSAECREGKFEIVTKEGSFAFNFVFGDESAHGRPIIQDAIVTQDSRAIPEMSDIEIANSMIEIIQSDMTAEDIIEIFLEDPRIIACAYKNNRLYCETIDGPFDIWFPCLKRRPQEEEQEGSPTEEC